MGNDLSASIRANPRRSASPLLRPARQPVRPRPHRSPSPTCPPDTGDHVRLGSPQTVVISVKRYAAGKVFGHTEGNPDFVDAVRVALAKALVLEPRLDLARFESVLREQGVPEAAIRGYVAEACVNDECWLQERMPG